MNNKKLPNQFEVFNLVLKSQKNSALREGVAYVVAVLCLMTTLIVLARPLPVVVKSDRPDEPTTIAFATADTFVREIDAKKFLFKTSKLLHGWSSGTVLKDLHEASLLMTPDWREQFLKATDEIIDVDSSVNSTGKAERVVVWAKSMVQNNMDLNWKQSECRMTENRWHCIGKGTLSARSIFPQSKSPEQKRVVEIRATFVQVPVTQLTMDGLLIDYFDMNEVNT